MIEKLLLSTQRLPLSRGFKQLPGRQRSTDGEAQALQVNNLQFNQGSVTSQLCDLKQITFTFQSLFSYLHNVYNTNLSGVVRMVLNMVPVYNECSPFSRLGLSLVAETK